MVKKISIGSPGPWQFLHNKNRTFIGVLVACVLLVMIMIGCQSRTNDLMALEITSPQNRAEVTEDIAMVSGIVSPPSAVVTVNGREVDVAEDGTFSRSVELEYGENTINVAALTADGEELTDKTLTVVRNLNLDIISPEDKEEVSYSPIILRGTVSDNEAEVRVNNRAVSVADDGSFFTAIDLNYVKNVITVEASVAGQKPVTRTLSVNRVLVLRLDTPAYQIEVTEGTAEVRGVVYPPSAMVTVNGQEIDTAADGSFYAVVELAYGENTIVVNATDPVTRTLTVNRELILEVDSPKDGTQFTSDKVAVSGTVSDPQVTVTVNDAPIEIDPDGTFTADVALAYGDNPITVRAVTEGDQPVTKTVSLEVSRVLTLNVTSPPADSELTEPQAVLLGIVSNPQAVLMVNDQEVTVNDEGVFAADVELEAGENVISLVATVGEEVSLSKTVTLYYVPSG